MSLSKISRIVTILAALVLGMSATPAAAQFGPILSGTGPINRSMGGTSTAAPLSAAGALLWNPATLSGLESSELEVGVELLFPQTSLSSTLGPASGRTENEDAVFALPTLAMAFRPEGSPLTYGLGVFAIAGFGLNYAGNESNPLQATTGLGFGPIYSQYQVLQIAPALVYQVTDQLSVSVSPLLDLGMGQLDPAIVTDPITPPTSYPSGTHSRHAWGGGFSVGAFYQAEDWSFGASYKSQQWFQSYRFSASDAAGAPISFEFDLDIPSVVSLGTSYKGFERWLLAADVRYFDFESTDGFGDSGFTPTGALRGFGFQNIFAITLGAQYQMTDAMSVRLGYSWNENPIPDDQTLANAASPVIIQNILSAGASYQVTDALSLSLAYSHGFDNSIRGSIAGPGTSISSTTSVDSLIVGATVKFGGSR